MTRTLLVDADTPLGRSLATALGHAGHPVITHARCGRDGLAVDCLHPNACDALDRMTRDGQPPERIVFGLPDVQASPDGQDHVDAMTRALDRFLEELQAACLALRRADHGQVWVMVADDSLGYFLEEPPAHPILTQGMIAAVRSAAKEVFPLDLRVNAFLVQPTCADLDPDRLQRRKGSLKTFAQRFRPPQPADVAQVLANLLVLPRLPMTGLLVPCGFGFTEANL